MHLNFLFLSKRILAVFLINFLILQFTLPCSLRAQEKSRDQRQENPQHEVAVTLKLIHVYVLDNKGNPGMDLDQSDFEIYDNGLLQPLYHFEKHILTIPEIKAGETKPAVPAEIPSKMNRKFFLFFDFGFSGLHGIQKAKQAGLHFIDTQLHPSDEVGVLSYSSSKSLTVHEFLTADHDKIRQIVQGLGLKEGLGRAERLEDFVLTSSMETQNEMLDKKMPSANDFFDRLAQERQGVKIDASARMTYRQQAFDFIYVLSNLAKAFRLIPGNKNIIFFSSGIARILLYGKKRVDLPDDTPRTVEERVKYMEAFSDMQGDSGIRDDYENMIKELKASNCPIYAVNVARTQDEIDSENLERASFGREELLGDDSLKQLSSKTGGRYYSNTMDSKRAVEDIKSLTSAYYVLGYSIDEKWDGKFHKVKVKVKRKGYDVFGQSGYFNPKPFSEYTKFEKLLHIIDLALSEAPQFQQPVDFSMVALPVYFKGEAQLVALSQIPKDKIQEIAGPKTELILLVFDEQNNVRALRSCQIDFSSLSQEKVYPYTVCPLPPGKYHCSLVLRNLKTGLGARASSFVSIPPKLESGLRLYPPLLLVPEQNVQYIEALAPVSLFNLYPFAASAYAPLITELSAGAKKLFAAVRCSMTGSLQPEINLSARLVELPNGTNSPLALSILSQAQEENTRLFFIEIPLGELKPGQYSLYLFAEEKNGPAVTHIITSLNLK